MVNARDNISKDKHGKVSSRYGYCHPQAPILCPLTCSVTLPSHPDVTNHPEETRHPSPPSQCMHPLSSDLWRRLPSAIRVRVPHTVRLSVQLERAATLVTIAQIESGGLLRLTRRWYV